MRTAEELAREAGDGYSLLSLTLYRTNGAVTHYRSGSGTEEAFLARLIALVRAEALEEAAQVCDVTPPYPFRPSIEAAHAIRALKAAQEQKG